MQILKSKKIIVFILIGVVIVSLILYIILNSGSYRVMGKSIPQENIKEGVYNPTGLVGYYYYDIDFLTNTITNYSAAFSYGGGGKPISPHKLASKKMSLSERIKLKKILKNYDKSKEIWINDELSKMLIF